MFSCSDNEDDAMKPLNNWNIKSYTATVTNPPLMPQLFVLRKGYADIMKNLYPFSIKIIFFILVFQCISCEKQKPEQTIFDKVAHIEDSLKVGNMVIRNAFKHQILAHKTGVFDSIMIHKNVYTPNQYTFDNCLGIIFGEENSGKFSIPGMYEWNRKLLVNDSLIKAKISVLDSVNINDLFTKHLKAVQDITGQNGYGSWMLYFGPQNFQIFGGCDKNAMILDMFGSQWNSEDINALFAHELEHLIFEPILEKDPYGKKGLGIVLDEGLAVYFTSVYLKQTREQALYDKYTTLLLEHEKIIFEKLKDFLYLDYKNGCPIFYHTGRTDECGAIVSIDGLPENVNRELGYFLGFRIIEKYVEKNGKHSWKDLYKIPLIEFYKKSGYTEFIQGSKNAG